MLFPECNDSRKCCFKDADRKLCLILESTFLKDGECSFAKPRRHDSPYNLVRHKMMENEKYKGYKW